MVTYVFGSLLIFYFTTTHYYQNEAYQVAVFHYTDDKIMSKVLSNLQQVVVLYTSALYYTFPVFIAYICMCLNTMVNVLHNKLKEIITSDELSIDCNFKDFINKFYQTVEMVSMVDECYSVNIVWYIIMLVHNIITWLYLQLVFDKCNINKMAVVKSMCDTIGLLILLVATSSVQSKVKFSSLLTDTDRQTHTHTNKQMKDIIFKFISFRLTILWDSWGNFVRWTIRQQSQRLAFCTSHRC